MNRMFQVAWIATLTFSLFSCNKDAPVRMPQSISIEETETFSKLSIDVSCSWSCDSFPSYQKRDTIQGVFDPKQWSDGRGNGNFLRRLSKSIDFFSFEVCMEHAKKKCGVQKVKSSQALYLQSNDWKAKLPLSCKSDQLVLSPYEPSLSPKTTREISPSSKIQDQIKKIKKSSLSTSPGKNCSHVIQIRSCFGDCMMFNENDEAVQTLASPTPLGTQTYYACVDSLTKETHQSLNILEKTHLCESYVWASFFESNTPQKSCAAIRGETTCSKWAKEI